jgi:hypothetical protein
MFHKIKLLNFLCLTANIWSYSSQNGKAHFSLERVLINTWDKKNYEQPSRLSLERFL